MVVTQEEISVFQLYTIGWLSIWKESMFAFLQQTDVVTVPAHIDRESPPTGMTANLFVVFLLWFKLFPPYSNVYCCWFFPHSASAFLKKKEMGIQCLKMLIHKMNLYLLSPLSLVFSLSNLLLSDSLLKAFQHVQRNLFTNQLIGGFLESLKCKNARASDPCGGLCLWKVLASSEQTSRSLHQTKCHDQPPFIYINNSE